MWRKLGENVDALTGTSILTAGGIWILRKIAGVIAIKKHVKKEPFKERIDATNSIVISNSENVQIVVFLEVYELFKSGTLDPDLDKITSPLVRGRIDAAEIEARSPDGTVLRERIEAEERPYFETVEVVVTTTRETWLIVKLNSLTKSTNSGWLYLSDGARVFYRYAGSNPNGLHVILDPTTGLFASGVSPTWMKISR